MSLLALRWRKLKAILRRRGVRYAFHFSWYYVLLKITDRFSTSRKLFFWWPPFPQHLEIEVTTRCNLRCLMCEHTYWAEPSRDMSFDSFCSIVEQFPTLRWLGLTGIGESFLHPEYMKMLEWAKERLITIEISDPLHFVTAVQVERMVQIGVDRLFISMDAATRKTYEQIRRGARFDRVLENIRLLFEKKHEEGNRVPEIFFHFVICKRNIHEILDFIELVHGLRRGQKATIQFSKLLHRFPEIDDLYVEVRQDDMEKANEMAARLGVHVIWNRSMTDRKPSMRECLAWIEPFIFVTGDVVPCCAGNEANRRTWQRENRLGNVFEKPFSRIWRGERYRDLRKRLREGGTPASCSYCTVYALQGQDEPCRRKKP